MLLAAYKSKVRPLSLIFSIISWHSILPHPRISILILLLLTPLVYSRIMEAIVHGFNISSLLIDYAWNLSSTIIVLAVSALTIYILAWLGRTGYTAIGGLLIISALLW
jgi:hypothetical protein